MIKGEGQNEEGQALPAGDGESWEGSACQAGPYLVSNFNLHKQWQ
jgi:hypothetical protein